MIVYFLTPWWAGQKRPSSWPLRNNHDEHSLFISISIFKTTHHHQFIYLFCFSIRYSFPFPISISISISQNSKPNIQNHFHFHFHFQINYFNSVKTFIFYLYLCARVWPCSTGTPKSYATSLCIYIAWSLPWFVHFWCFKWGYYLISVYLVKSLFYL